MTFIVTIGYIKSFIQYHTDKGLFPGKHLSPPDDPLRWIRLDWTPGIPPGLITVVSKECKNKVFNHSGLNHSNFLISLARAITTTHSLWIPETRHDVPSTARPAHQRSLEFFSSTTGIPSLILQCTISGITISLSQTLHFMPSLPGFAGRAVSLWA